MEKDTRKHKYYSTQVMLLFRVIICAYIVYQAYSLTIGYINGDGLNIIVLIIVDILFLGIGLGLGIKSLYDLFTGRYSGGKLDIIQDTEEKDENNDNQD